MNTAKETAHVTLEEFEAMEKDERFNYELIDGVVMMSPSPSREHQFIGINVIDKLLLCLRHSKCRPVHELDICFADNIFRPDIMVLCDKDAELPEIIVEILSPSTRYLDLSLKVTHYKEAGVKEYWIVDPKIKTVTVHDFVNHTAESYRIDEIIQSKAIPEIIIAVTDIFA